jgi:hypothetical protein
MQIVRILLFLGLFLFASTPFATILDDNQCKGYASTVANITILKMQGMRQKDFNKELDNESFLNLPKDIQLLVRTTIEYVLHLDESPEENAQGAYMFCATLKGDTELMTSILRQELDKGKTKV